MCGITTACDWDNHLAGFEIQDCRFRKAGGQGAGSGGGVEPSAEDPICEEEQADEESGAADDEIDRGRVSEVGDPEIVQAERDESHAAHPIPLPGEDKNDGKDGSGNKVNGQGKHQLGERKVCVKHVKREEADEQRVDNAPHPGCPVKHPFAGSDHGFSRSIDYS